MHDSSSKNQALLARFEAVRQRLAAAERFAGRKAGEVTLVAVSKWHPASRLAALAGYLEANGQHITFSENYIQEALGKQDELAAAGLHCHWHFSGHLQSNKARQAFGRFELLHTLDSLSLAQNLQKEYEKLDEKRQTGSLMETAAVIPQPVLLQVNVGHEAQKSGVMPEDMPEFIEKIQQLPGIAILGLMCLPPFSEEAEASRPYFSGLRQLRDRLESRCGLKLPRLSMGMSHDFEVAVQEGANLVRVGTDIFGPRA